MNMFGVFLLKITPVTAKTVTPIFVKIPKKWGFHKNDEFFTFPEFFTKKCLFSQKYLLEDANSENDVTNRKIHSVAAFQKWLKMTKNGHFLTFDPPFSPKLFIEKPQKPQKWEIRGW